MEDLTPQLRDIIADMVFQIAYLKQQLEIKEMQVASLKAAKGSDSSIVP